MAIGSFQELIATILLMVIPDPVVWVVLFLLGLVFVIVITITNGITAVLVLFVIISFSCYLDLEPIALSNEVRLGSSFSRSTLCAINIAVPRCPLLAVSVGVGDRVVFVDPDEIAIFIRSVAHDLARFTRLESRITSQIV